MNLLRRRTKSIAKLLQFFPVIQELYCTNKDAMKDQQVLRARAEDQGPGLGS